MPRVLNIRDYGYKLPDGAVYIGRVMPEYGLKASKWQNPFKVGPHGTRAQVLEQYRQWAAQQPGYREAVRRELAGRDLVCWCAPKPCHGDLLMEWAKERPGIST